MYLQIYYTYSVEKGVEEIILQYILEIDYRGNNNNNNINRGAYNII